MKNGKKKESEFDFNRFMDEVMGQLVLSIGRGDFKQTLFAYLQTLNSNAYQRGCADTRKEQANRRKRK